MKKIFFICLVTVTLISAQYSLKSYHLSEPERTIPYVDSCASFWFGTLDNTYGGFYTDVNRQGVNSSTYKSLLTQARMAYGMNRAFMMTGNSEYLTYAREALNFMYDNAWDKLNKGWINDMNRNGSASNINANKTAFYQHYALLGILASCEVTDDSLDWDWFYKAYQNNEERLWDSRAGYEGYYDNVSANWSVKSGKSFNATVDAITTHALNLYLMTGEQVYLDKLLMIKDNIIDWLIPSMESQAIGFAEEYDGNWNIDPNETMTIMGHILKTSWCLGRVYQITKDESLLEPMMLLADHVLDNGYDHKYGGPYKDFNRTTGEMLMWGQDTAKAWWQMQQAVMAGLMLYDVTGEERYIKMADETLKFFMDYFVDHTYGEVYSDRFKNGSAITAWGTSKGGGGKGAYHSIELGYYVYLYGNLYYHKKPVSLYYNFEPKNSERQIKLTPLAIDDARLRIKSVTLDGAEYANFNSLERIVNIPENTGGIFKVEFDTQTTSAEESQTIIAKEFSLEQNYPNPFNPATTIRYALPKDGAVRLTIYNLLGQEVTTLVNEYKLKGRYEVKFDASGLGSGMYIYKIESGSFSNSKRMMLVK